jgi:hypothetical protein
VRNVPRNLIDGSSCMNYYLGYDISGIEERYFKSELSWR